MAAPRKPTKTTRLPTSSGHNTFISGIHNENVTNMNLLVNGGDSGIGGYTVTLEEASIILNGLIVVVLRG